MTVPGVVLIFAGTYIFVLALSAGEVGAAWIQAIGTVMALIGAIYLPIIHGDHLATKRELMILGQMRLIAEDCYEKLWMLSNCFLLADRESQAIGAYLSHGRAQEWGAIVTALNQIPLHEVPPEHVGTLAVMRNAAAQAVFVCSLLDKWIVDASHPGIIELLRGRRDILAIKKAKLPWPAGVPDTVDRDNQERGRNYEMATPPLGSINVLGLKVYRQYFGMTATGPEWVRVQIVSPLGNECAHSFQLEKDLPPGWADMAGAEAAVRDKAEEYIKDFCAQDY